MRYRNIEILDSLTWLMHEADSRITARGLDYFYLNRVTKLSNRDGIYFAKVRGNETYTVQIDPEEEDATCNCPAPYPCKHLIAVVFYISTREENKNISDSSNVIHFPPKPGQSAAFQQTELIYPKSGKSAEFIFQAIDDRRFSPKKFNPVTNQISAINPGEQLRLSDGSRIDYYYLINLVSMPYREIYFQDIMNDRNYGKFRFFSQDGRPMSFAGFLMIQHRLVVVENIKPVSEISGNPDTDSEAITNKEYFLKSFYKDPVTFEEISCEVSDKTQFFSNRIFSKIHMVEKTETTNKNPEGDESAKPAPDKILTFYIALFSRVNESLYSFAWGGARPLTDLNVAEWKDIMTEAKVENLKKLAPKIFDKGPVFSLSIYPDEKGLFQVKCRTEFIYSLQNKYLDDKLLARTLSGKSAFKFLARFSARASASHQPVKFQKDAFGNIARRDNKLEKQIFKAYEQSPIPFHKKEFILKPGEISDFIQNQVPKLQKKGAKIHIHKNLLRLMQNPKGNRALFKMNTKSSDINWFDGHISIEGMGLRELRLALKAYKKKEDYFRLKDGSWVSLDSIGIKKLLSSFDNLGIHILNDGEVKKVNRGQMLAIEFEMDSRTDTAMFNMVKKIKSLPDIRKTHPVTFETGFQGILRDYQKEGVLFLESLYDIEIGGILADDMGLGKTIQGLAFIERLTRKKSNLLTLIVGPLASISVWKKEAQKYFPQLKITLWHGTERKKTDFPAEGIVLTTYGTLSRDYADWKERHHFDLAILDEAQNLKNFRSLSSHAVRQTNTSLYFCLTGTPLENSLIDLWSLFDICFPGYLGTQKSFQKIYSETDWGLHQNLRSKIEPFVLRRTKDEVLKELPPLTETLVPVSMTDRQKTFYEEARRQAVMELANAGQNYLIVMLPHLMKLRRIACHPEAGNSETTDPLLSGKFQHLKDILEEMKVSASGILIFSQFTDILKICGRLLENMGHDYHYLDGSTPLKKREKMVTGFQNGEKSFFLISLKAGGTALTLHRADTVIHLDPWWNPAVERQASDRVHRIGQKKKVFVYKLYSENSIEEKVLELQTIKKELFNSLFGENISKSAPVTREQLMQLLER